MLIKIQTFAQNDTWNFQKFFVGFVVLKNNPTHPKYFS